MAGQNIDQVYTDNPITTNAGTDLMYFGQSPYGIGDDAAMLYSDFQNQFGTLIEEAAFVAGIDSGIADAYVVTLSPSAAFTAANGTAVSFSPLNDNATTAPTLAVNGASALPIVLPNNQPVVAGDIATGSVAAYCIYSNGVWMLMNPIVSFGGQVTPQQIQENAFCNGTDSGAADAYVVTLNPSAAFTAQQGSVVSFTPLNVNLTNVPTVAVNGNAAANIVLPNGVQVLPGDINTQCYLILGSSGNYILLTPAISYVTPADIAGSTFIRAIDTGIAANAYVYSNVAGNLQAGSIIVLLQANATNTGASTIHNGVNIDIKLINGDALSGGEIVANKDYIFLFTATTFILLNPSVETILAHSIQFTPTTSGIIGVTDGSSAGTRIVGEIIDAGALSLSSFSSSGVYQPIGNVLLSAGNWVLYAYLQIIPTGLTTSTSCGISTTSTSLTPISTTAESGFSDNAGISAISMSPVGWINISTSTTIYLTAEVTTSSGNASAEGGMFAVRIR